MSKTFSDKKAVRFKLSKEHLRMLMSGQVVRIEDMSDMPVEFFLSDFVGEIKQVVDCEREKVLKNLSGK